MPNIKNFLKDINYPQKELILKNLRIANVDANYFATTFNLPLNPTIIFGYIIDPNNMYELQRLGYRNEKISAYNGKSRKLSFNTVITSTRCASRSNYHG